MLAQLLPVLISCLRSSADVIVMTAHAMCEINNYNIYQAAEHVGCAGSHRELNKCL